MNFVLDPRYVRISRRLARVCGVSVFIIGWIVIFGWILGLEPLKSVITGLATMKANTAITFIFAGVAVWLSAFENPRPIQLVLMRICAGVVALLGLLSLGEYITGINFGIDQFLFVDLNTPLASFPGRMSINTALNFSMIGIGLLFMNSRWKQSLRLTQTLTLVVYAITAVALVGYIYDVQALYRVGPFASMALNTAISFFLLVNGTLLAQPNRGIVGQLLSDSIGGRILRRFLPVVLGVPIGLSLLVLFGEKYDLYNLNFGLAVMVILNVSFISIALWVGSRWMNQLDEQRTRAYEALRVSEASLKQSQAVAHVGHWSWDTQTNQVAWSDEMYRIFGIDPRAFTGDLNEIIAQAIHPDDRAKVTRANKAVISEQTPVPLEYRVIWPDQSVRTVWAQAGEKITDKNDKILRLTGIVQDITERKLAEENIERQNQRLKILREIDVAILAADSVESIVSSALDHIRELIDCRRTNLTLIDRGTNEAVIFGVRTAGETSIQAGRRLPLAQFKDILPTLSQNQPILFSDFHALADPMPGIQSLLKEGLRSTCSLPLLSRGQLIGMFSMHSEIPGFFDEEKISLGREVANQVALAITQKNLLEGLSDQQARTAGIINSAMDAIISIDAEQQIVLFNPAAEVMFQCVQTDAVGQPVERFLPDRFRAGHSKHIQQFAQTGVTSRAMGKLGTIYGLRRNGEEFPIEASISQTQVTGKDIFTVILRDVTERQHTEDELKRSNTELEQFAYVASHDLQEPLRAVAGMVQLLGQRYKGKLDERADEYIGHAVEASTRMQSLINDLLDYSRVGRLGGPFAPTDLEKTLDTALANLQLAVQESGAEIKRDPLPTIVVDAGQLTQVLQNLIGNAIKFRGVGSPKIHIGAEKLENGWRFSVRDNGIGIEPQYFDRIFLVFQRLHTRREYSGTGIGLSLCKKIVERHGGEIWVESQPEQGTTFYFTILERQT